LNWRVFLNEQIEHLLPFLQFVIAQRILGYRVPIVALEPVILLNSVLKKDHLRLGLLIGIDVKGIALLKVSVFLLDRVKIFLGDMLFQVFEHVSLVKVLKQ
jgi:hypothetical protein